MSQFSTLATTPPGITDHSYVERERDGNPHNTYIYFSESITVCLGFQLINRTKHFSILLKSRQESIKETENANLYNSLRELAKLNVSQSYSKTLKTSEIRDGKNW